MRAIDEWVSENQTAQKLVDKGDARMNPIALQCITCIIMQNSVVFVSDMMEHLPWSLFSLSLQWHLSGLDSPSKLFNKTTTLTWLQISVWKTWSKAPGPDTTLCIFIELWKYYYSQKSENWTTVPMFFGASYALTHHVQHTAREWTKKKASHLSCVSPCMWLVCMKFSKHICTGLWGWPLVWQEGSWSNWQNCWDGDTTCSPLAAWWQVINIHTASTSTRALTGIKEEAVASLGLCAPHKGFCFVTINTWQPGD